MQNPVVDKFRLDAAHYVPERDGPMQAYLDSCQNERRNGLFLGPRQYQALWDANLLEPGITSIRIMHGQGSDEHYIIVDRATAIGLEGQYHGGKSGLQKIDQVIPVQGTMFEIYMWKR